MTDDFYKPNRPPAPRRVPHHGEPLFEFLHGQDRYLCELRDHGEVYGFFCSRRFDPRTNPTRPPRELAIAWAEEERATIERGGG